MSKNAKFKYFPRLNDVNVHDRTLDIMDVFTLVEGYMNKMFSGIEGMKILLVDRETVYIEALPSKVVHL